jgi:hypothetical protein
MPNRSVSCFCENAGKAAAVALCTSFGDGPGTFSVPLSTQAGVTDRAQATHWGMSGDINADEVAAMEVSLDPKCWVFELNPQGGAPLSFDDHLAMCSPPLHRIVEGL